MTDTLTGEFSVIEPSKLASPTSRNPIARAHYELVRELIRLQVPSISINPLPEEFEDVADYLNRLAAMVDRFVEAIGIEVKSNAVCSVDLDCFKSQIANAVYDNVVGQVDKAAEACREQREEIAQAVRHGRHVGRIIEDIYRHMGLPRE